LLADLTRLDLRAIDKRMRRGPVFFWYCHVVVPLVVIL
jgi:hypothetical protein